MKILDLLNKLKENNIFVEVINGELDIVVKDDNLTDELLNDIRTNKEDIIKYFSNKGKTRTPSDFTFKGMKLKEYKNLLEKKHISDLEVQDIYNLTSLQEGFLFHGLMDNKSSAYFEQISFDLSGDININSFKKSWEIIVSRHDVFRSIFISDFREPVQVVLKERELDFTFSDFSFENYFDVKLTELKNMDRERAFHFERDNLFRINIIKQSNKEYTLVVSFHHIIMDGWCIPIIMSEFFNIYSSLLEDGLFKLESPGKYSDYIKWINNRDTYTDLEFWNNYLNGYEELATIPKDVNSNSKGNLPLSYSFSIDKNNSDSITKLSGKLGVTLSTLIQSLWGILLSIYNRTDDVIFGSTISGRPQDIEGVEKIVGLFINTIPVRIKQADAHTFSELVKSVARESIKCLKYHHSSLADIQSETNLKDGLFDHIVVFENYPINGVINGNADIRIENIDYFEQVNYDFFISVFPGDTIEFKLNYNPNKFSEERIKRIAGHINCLISSVIKNPDLDIRNIDILPDNEKLEIKKFGTSAFDSVTNKTVIDVFEEKVDKYPDKLAVVYKDIELTYGELNKKANILGNYLQNEYNIKADDLIGVALDRSEKMIIALLGIMKSGAAYIPLDPEHPEERTSYVINDAKPKVVLNEDAITRILGENSNDKNPVKIISSDSLAYVIYTSGSTGRPKGVLIEHNGVCNILSFLESQYSLGVKDRFLLKTNYTFDVSVTELFGWFFGDGELAILEKGLEKEPYSLVRYINEKNITHVNFAPSMFNEFLSCIDENEYNLNSLKYVFVAGEAFNAGLVEKLDVLDKSVRVENIYGPTEATIYASVFSINRSQKYNSVPIGKPVGNTTLRIVDKNNNIVPIGVPGELCISGIGLARGYLNNKELTNEKFINNSGISNEIMYKTGDLVAWLPNGNIEFWGRLDNQVKIRGFRIELGEIECLFTKYRGIKNSTVTIHEDKNSDKSIIAYYEADTTIEKSEIRSFLSESLPYYMIPSYFIQLDKIPVNSSGKVDKKNLPTPDKIQIIKKEFQEPENDTQRKLCDIWEYVLGIEKVGIHDNFFELGGHSLKATRIISKIYRELEVKLELKSIFEKPTIKELSLIINESANTVFSEIKVLEKRDYYDLSSAQRRLWILNQFEGAGSVYNMPGVYSVDGDLDINAFNNAYSYMINRHESLRTIFVNIEGEPKQKIITTQDFNLEFINLESNLNGEDEAKIIVEKDIKTTFILDEGPLLRITVIKIKDEKFLLLFNMHHIVSDGWSLNVFIKEFMYAYNCYGNNEIPGLKPLKIHYKDYSAWQNELLNSNDMDNQREYWLEKLADVEVLNLSTDYPRPIIQTYNGSEYNFELDKETVFKLKKLCNEKELSLFMLLQAFIKILLHKYTGQKDITLGSPIAGRQHEDLENQIGFYVNTIALRDSISCNNSFDEVLSNVKNTCIEVYENQDYPFDSIVEELELDRDMSRSPLFDVMLVLQNNDTISFDFKGLKFSKYKINRKISKYDLTFAFNESENKLLCNVEYNTDLFTINRIKRIETHLNTIILSVLNNPEIKMSDLDILSEEEKYQLLTDFNKTEKDYPLNKTIIELFEDQVYKTPDSIALIFEGIEITYKELNEKANIIGRNLIEKYDVKVDDKVDDKVGVLLNRSEDLVTILLGILKTGAAYVPIDPEYPVDRIEYIINDSKPKVVISKDNLETITTANSIENIGLKVSSDTLMYIIYTSGTTGLPKGTLITNANFGNYINWAKEYYFNSTDSGNFPLFTSLSFDLTTTSIYLTLLRGKSLTVFRQGDDIAGILRTIFSNGIIDSVKLTPSHISILKELNIKDSNVSLSIVGGEELLSQQVNILKTINTEMEIVNEYGPTEATVGCIIKRIEDVDEKILIGKPISNTQIYILDSLGNIQPMGIPGEIYIGGLSVGAGYLNRSDLTKNKFIPNPFLPGEIMYKTGDIARWLDCGNIEYLGRVDDQVKIRGHRIELGEIENTLLEFESITSITTSVLKSSSGDKYITAYYVSEEVLELKDFRTYLGKTIPDYMIPSYFIKVDEIPLTSNGKVDKNKLPDPVKNGVSTSNNYYPPETELQGILVEIWLDILNKQERIGIDDNFFELGGDSIKAIQIVSRLSQKGYKGEVSTLFNNPTIRGFVDYIKEDSNNLDQSLVTGDVPLSPIQSWFFNYYEYEKTHYNQSIILKVQDKLNEKKISILKSIVEKLLIHHDALRMSYSYKGDIVTQYNRSDSSYSFKVYDLLDIEKPLEKLKEFSNEIQSSFNLENDTLIKFALFKLNDGYRLLIVAHHLVIDGVSWRILIEDLENGYKQLLESKEITLPKKTTSFKEWCYQLEKYSLSNNFKEESKYWESVDKKITSLVSTPGISMIKSFSKINLTVPETELLLTRCHQAFNTQINDILLTALSRALCTWNGEDSISIEMESHGRSEIIENADISRTIGWFTSLYPIVFEGINKNEISEDIVNVKETLREVPNNGIGYGIYRYLNNSTEKKSFKNSPDIVFNYLGQFDNKTGSDLFKISSENCGSNIPDSAKNPYKLSFNGMVSMDQLSMTLDSDVYSQETLNDIQKLFLKELRSILAYTDDFIQLAEDFNTTSDHSENTENEEIYI